MAFGYPDSATGASPAASTARLVTSQPIHSSIYPPAITWPYIYLPSISPSIHTYISICIHQTTHPPIHPSAHSSSLRLLFIYPLIPPPMYPSIHHLSTIHTPSSPSIVYPHTYCPTIHLSCLPTCLQLPSFELVSSFQKLRIPGLSWGYCGDAKVLGPSSSLSTHPKVPRQGTCRPSWLERSKSTYPQVNS